MGYNLMDFYSIETNTISNPFFIPTLSNCTIVTLIHPLQTNIRFLIWCSSDFPENYLFPNFNYTLLHLFECPLVCVRVCVCVFVCVCACVRQSCQPIDQIEPLLSVLLNSKDCSKGIFKP